MKSFGRPNRQALAEEAQKRKLEMNEKNFPSFGAGAAKPKTDTSGPTFAKLADNWKKADEYAKFREEMKRKDEAHERFLNKGVFIFNRPKRKIEDREEEEEYEEEEEQVSDEWTTVDTRTRKPKKQMTDAELERYAAQHSDDEDDDENDYNGHLTEANQRREFY